MKEHGSLVRVGAHIRVNYILHTCIWYNVVTLRGLVRAIFLVGPIGHDEETRGDGATLWLLYRHVMRACTSAHLRWLIENALETKNDLSLIIHLHYVLPVKTNILYINEIYKRMLQDICIAIW